MTNRNLMWAITGVLALGVLALEAHIAALNLGAVMHDLHCPDHGSLAQSAET